MPVNRSVILGVSLLTLAAGALAFTSDAAPSVRATEPDEIAKPAAPLADHPIAGMVGHWEGTVTSIGRDGAWHEGIAVERARWNLAGTAILVEGYGYTEDPDTGERTVGHDAFGLIEWDPATDAPVFHAHRRGGKFEAHAITLDEGTGDLLWSNDQGTTQIRFTITLKGDHWKEVGEMSRDGGNTWNKFLETNLTRVTGD